MPLHCAPGVLPAQEAYTLLQRQLAPLLNGVQWLLLLKRAGTPEAGYGLPMYHLEGMAAGCFQSVSDLYSHSPRLSHAAQPRCILPR